MKREEVTGNVRARPAAAEREAGGTSLYPKHYTSTSTWPASERMGNAGASQVCTKLAHACYLAEESLVEARVHLRLYPKPLFFLCTGRGAFLFLLQGEKEMGGAFRTSQQVNALLAKK